MDQKKRAALFKKKHKIKVISSKELFRALGDQGYTVIEYNGVKESPDVEVLKVELNLETWMKQSRCFTYQDDKYRLLFVQEGLTEEEQQIVLAHEIGHICNSHFSKGCVIGDDVFQEYEANEFAHFLLKDKRGIIKRTKIIAICVVLALVSGISAGIILKNKHDKAVYTDDLYRTESGSKYHIRDCIYIKDKTDVYRLTIEEFNSGKYEPCEACKPDERQ